MSTLAAELPASARGTSAIVPTGERRERVSSMCAGQESKREVRDRRSVG